MGQSPEVVCLDVIDVYISASASSSIVVEVVALVPVLCTEGRHVEVVKLLEFLGVVDVVDAPSLDEAKRVVVCVSPRINLDLCAAWAQCPAQWHACVVLDVVGLVYLFVPVDRADLHDAAMKRSNASVVFVVTRGLGDEAGRVRAGGRSLSASVASHVWLSDGFVGCF